MKKEKKERYTELVKNIGNLPGNKQDNIAWYIKGFVDSENSRNKKE